MLCPSDLLPGTSGRGQQHVIRRAAQQVNDPRTDCQWRTTHVNVTTAAAAGHTQPKSEDATMATVTCMSSVSWMEHRKRSGNRGACSCSFAGAILSIEQASERASSRAPGLCRCRIMGHSLNDMAAGARQQAKRCSRIPAQLVQACTARHLRMQAASTHTTAVLLLPPASTHTLLQYSGHRRLTGFLQSSGLQAKEAGFSGRQASSLDRFEL
jgi:hypothetical protein